MSYTTHCQNFSATCMSNARKIRSLGNQITLFIWRPCRYIPRSSDDVFQTEKLLHTSLGLPLTIVWDILEHAEYWVRSVGSGGKGVGWYIPLNPRNPMGVTVITRIPETVKGYRPVRRVIFTIAAYESGESTMSGVIELLSW